MTNSEENTSGPRGYRGPGIPPKWIPVVLVTLGCIWAIHYVWHTNNNSYGDEDTVLFINFLIWPLIASAFLVAISSLRGKTEDAPVGLSDHRRLMLLIAVPIYGIAVAYGGFVLASVAFVLLFLPMLGVRNPIILLGISAFVVTIIWFGFSYLMSVPLPLWPRGVTF